MTSNTSEVPLVTSDMLGEFEMKDILKKFMQPANIERDQSPLKQEVQLPVNLSKLANLKLEPAKMFEIQRSFRDKTKRDKFREDPNLQQYIENNKVR